MVDPALRTPAFVAAQTSMLSFILLARRCAGPLVHICWADVVGSAVLWTAWLAA